MSQRIPDDVIIDALVKGGSVRAASKKLGISERTIANRLQNVKFRQRYEDAKSSILTEAVEGMKQRVKLAVNTLTEVMQEKNNPATVRVSAADAMLRHFVRYIEVAEMEKRITALERSNEANELGEQAESP